jgi:hypothetical protein
MLQAGFLIAVLQQRGAVAPQENDRGDAPLVLSLIQSHAVFTAPAAPRS